MSLQAGSIDSNYINQYAKYYTGVSEAVQRTAAANGVNSQRVIVEDDYDTKMMKRLGVKECSTCQNRKYIDGSDDPGVSFKAPAHISPESSGAAVTAHEQEHVSRESSKAKAEGRRVVSQSVQLYTSVCPECGKVYTSGGKTTTTTKADKKNSDYFMDSMKKFFGKHYGKFIDIRL